MRFSESVLVKTVQIVCLCLMFLPGYPRVQNSVAAESAGANVLFILDGSGSMWGRLEYIFEVGPAVEPTALAISQDSEEWIELGEIAGGEASIDISPFVKPGDEFRYVALMDLKTHCDGDSPGADIDAVGTIGSILKTGAESSTVEQEEGQPKTETERAGAKPYAIVCVSNETDWQINYMYKWGDDPWESGSLEPNYISWYSWEYDPGETASPDFTILFDADFSNKENQKTYILERYEANQQSCEEGKVYSFKKSGKQAIDLYPEN
ncbi:membrane protein, OmpA family [Candidatus Vecturithrix granuli]|uniref:Membrane protein, OmpA family n=1 Tax=Vecturithrix granuli TaxID=1499967 RepID=A0A081C1A2_VECG1|nr:membrane protein, OmpA family [Candidatus Vecturithrix granuli]